MCSSRERTLRDRATSMSYPDSHQLEGFPDERTEPLCSDEFDQPYTPEVMRPFYDDFTPWISLEQYGGCPANSLFHSLRDGAR